MLALNPVHLTTHCMHAALLAVAHTHTPRLPYVNPGARHTPRGSAITTTDQDLPAVITVVTRQVAGQWPSTPSQSMGSTAGPRGAAGAGGQTATRSSCSSGGRVLVCVGVGGEGAGGEAAGRFEVCWLRCLEGNNFVCNHQRKCSCKARACVPHSAPPKLSGCVAKCHCNKPPASASSLVACLLQYALRFMCLSAAAEMEIDAQPILPMAQLSAFSAPQT